MTRLGLGVSLSVCTILATGFVACVGDDPAPSTVAEGDASTSQDGAGPDGTGPSDSDGSTNDAEAGVPIPAGGVVWAVHADRAGDRSLDGHPVTLAVGPNDVIGVASIYGAPTAVGSLQVPDSGRRALSFLLGADQTVKWAAGYPLAVVDASAMDAAGNVYIAGWYEGASITLGSKTLTNKNSDPTLASGFYAKLSGVDGSVLWAVSIADTGGVNSSCSTIGVRGTDVVVGCNFSGPISFLSKENGVTKWVPQDEWGDLVVIALDPADTGGRALWSKWVHGGDIDYVSSVAFDTTGNVVMAGSFSSFDIVVDSAQTSTLTKTSQESDAFVLRFDGAGSHAVSLAKSWKNSGIGSILPNAIAVAPVSGDIGVCGAFNAPANFGQGEVPAPAGQDAFVMRLDSGGTTRWVKTYGGSGNDMCGAMAFDSFDRIAIGGTHRSGNVSISGQALPAMTGASAGYVAKLSATGDGLWAHGVNGTNATVGSVGFLSGGDVVYSGAFVGTTDLGGGSLQSASGGTKSSLFVVRRAP